MKRSWRLLGLVLMAVVCLAVAALLRPAVGHEAEMAGSIDDTQATSTAQEPDTGEDGPQILVLNYHKVSDEFLSLAVAPADFDWQMRYLKEHGYHAITPDELYDALEGTGQLPANPVLITFDDGYQDNYDNAYPILRKYGLKGTVFVVTSFLGTRKGYLTWDECREMEKNGMTVASHTVDHKSMTDLTNDQLRAELVESKKKAEAELGHEVKYMAYPTGAYNLHIAQLVREAGYKAAFTIKYGGVSRKSNIYALERVPIFHTEKTNRDFIERIHYTPQFESFGWTKH